MATQAIFAKPAPASEANLECDQRIANVLTMVASLARIQLHALGNEAAPVEKAKDALQEMVQRIEAIARQHRMVADNCTGESADTAKYLREVCDAAIENFSRTRPVTLSFDHVPCPALPPERLTALGLIVNEAVVNAIKYAHPTGVAGKLKLVCRPVGETTLLVSVEDDGVGLPEGVNAQSATSMGFRLMRSLAEQLGATLSFRSVSLGLTVQILLEL